MLISHYKDRNIMQYVFDNEIEALNKFFEIKEKLKKEKHFYSSVNIIKSNNKFYINSPASDFIRDWELELFYYHN